MSARNKLIVGLTASTAAGASWVGLRLYVRNEVLKSLVKDYDYPNLKAKMDQFAAPFGINLNLPTAEAFATGLAPIWSLSTPYQAIEDVLAKGRSSIYWPKDYRETPKGGERVEKAIFKALEAAYRTPEGASRKDMALAAGKAIAADLTKLDLSKIDLSIIGLAGVV